MSTGIAWPGNPDAAPDPLPVQALDQATGYLMAACALRGLLQTRATAHGSIWRLSLARTALLLGEGRATQPGQMPDTLSATAPPDAYGSVPEPTAWGPAYRLLPPCRIGDAVWSWDRGAVALRSDTPTFQALGGGPAR